MQTVKAPNRVRVSQRRGSGGGAEGPDAPQVEAEWPAISVLVVTSRDGPGLRRCLARVREQADPLGAELVLVINAAAETLAPEAARELGRLCHVLAFEPRTGKSHGLNTGVSHCRGEVVAFTDDDAIPERGWLGEITAPLLDPQRPPELVGAGGHVEPVYPRGGPPRWYRRLLAGKSTHFLGPIHDLGDEPHDYPVPARGRLSAPLGVNCAYRREVFERYRYSPELGPNRETGLRGGEDFELGMRMILDGWRLAHLPAARVQHPVDPGRMTVENVRRHYYANGVELVRMLRMLGIPPPPAEELGRVLDRRRRRRWRRLLLDPRGRRRRAFKLFATRGMMDELQRAARSDRKTPGSVG